MKQLRPSLYVWAAGAVLLAATVPATADTLCVGHANSPCDQTFATIQNAVTQAASDYNGSSMIDTINVGIGTYHESVKITTPLSLIGAGAQNTIINATGLANGIFVDGGTDNNADVASAVPNTLRDVTISGFTVENANYEGILVANASYVTLWHNTVAFNDQALTFTNAGPDCPGLSAFETNEAFDCGEGIHLTGVDHATIADNDVESNAGGILVSDDTGPTFDNLITRNTVANNPYDCGITLPSHAPYSNLTSTSTPPAPLSWGVYDNTVSGNLSSANGLKGEGAGVGLFASSPGTQTYGNVVIGNRLIGNGLPGVALHSHTPGQNLNDNTITQNYISGNGGDSTVETDPVPTGISLLATSPNSGTLISQNVIKNESTDIAINLTSNSDSSVSVQLNDLMGAGAIGVANLASGSVNATENWWGANWWGCSGGPNAVGCTTTDGSNITTTPFLSRPVGPNVAILGGQGRGH